MQGNIWKIIIITSALLCALGTCAWGADIYVDATNGNDANDGLSWGSAKRTIDNAWDEICTVAGPNPDGVIFHITEGSYPELIISDLPEPQSCIPNSVSFSNLQFLGGYPAGGGVRDSLIYTTFIEGGFRVYFFQTMGGIDGLTLDGFTIQNGTGVYYQCPLVCDFENWSPVPGECDCVAYQEQDTLSLGGGIFLLNDGYYQQVISNVTIQNCLIQNNSVSAHNAWDCGPEPDGCYANQSMACPHYYRKGLGAAIFANGVDGLTIQNNIIRDNSVYYDCHWGYCNSAGGWLYQDEDIYTSSNCSNITLSANTFINNRPVEQTSSPDADTDGVPDSCDPCTDTDGDGYGSLGYARNACADDNCPTISNPGQEDGDSNGTGDACEACLDSDQDGYGLAPCPSDNCPSDFNPSQSDVDSDGVGDACDTCTDTDNDGYGNPGYAFNTCPEDNCPALSNPLQTDGDADGVGDDCDICPGFNDLLDPDGDGVPDGCDPCPLDNPDDSDADGVCDSVDICPGFDDNVDTDGDSIPDGCDACPGFDDAVDTDGDGVPDGCDPCPIDNPDDSDGDSVCDSVDICPGFDDNVDTDGDSIPDGCDFCSGSTPDGIIRVTDTTDQMYITGIDNGMICWRQRMGGDSSFYEMMLWDGTQIIQLTDNNYNDGHFLGSSLHNGQVAWGAVPIVGFDSEIYFYDGSSVMLVPNSYPGEYPQIHNGKIVWHTENGATPGIYYWDGVVTSYLGAGVYPQIHNNQIVWENSGEIYYWNGGPAINLSNDGSYADKAPSIHNGQVVWKKASSPGGTYEVMFWDGLTVTQITNSAYLNVFPSIHNSQLAWSATDGSNWEIFIWDGEVQQLTNNSTQDVSMSFSDGQVSWSGYDGNDFEIYYWDGSSTRQITTNSDDDLPSFISNGEIAWYNDGVWDIYFWSDKDGDDFNDLCDDCVDPDNDGYGSPGFPESVCPADNCPDVYNPGQDPADSDADGTPDTCDLCPGFDDFLDSDGDGTMDGCDLCPGFDDRVDSDGDGVPNGCDPCPLDNPDDSDGDSVCDSLDVCPGFDDFADGDGDSAPDGCDACPGFDDTLDSDGDGTADGCDLCPGFDDLFDIDGDGVPGGCDDCIDTDNDGYGDPGYPTNVCPLDNCPDISNPGQDPTDSDSDGTPDTCDLCPGFDDALDTDGDGIPDDCDNCVLGKSTQQLTNTSFNSTNPNMYLNQAVWEGDGIWFWDGISSTQLSSSGTNPQIHNGQVVWVDGGIWLWDGISSVELSPTGSDPQIHNGQVVWADGGVYFWDGSSISQLSASGTNPRIHNAQAAWEALGGVWFWNGVSTTEIAASGINLELHNGQIAWRENVLGQWEIMFWNGVSTIQVTSNTVTEIELDLHNGQLAWKAPTPSNEIFFWDGTTTTQISSNGVNTWGPQIHNGQVVWEGSDGSDREIYFWDGSSVTNITNNTVHDRYPQIYEGSLTWQGRVLPENYWQVFVHSPDLSDTDGDGVPDTCDLCPGFDDSLDADVDGIPDGCDSCPLDWSNDSDGDSICGNLDNCPGAANPLQEDSNSDGVGDACDGILGVVSDGVMVVGPMMTAASANAGADIALTWDSLSCPSGNYLFYWGDFSSLASYSYTGSECGLGVTGTKDVPMPPGNIFFYVVGTDNLGVESVNGFDSSGASISASGVGLCGVASQAAVPGCP